MQNDDTKKPIVEEEKTTQDVASNAIENTQDQTQEKPEETQTTAQETAEPEIKASKAEETQKPAKEESLEPEEKAKEEKEKQPKPSTPSDNAKWYIVHTYSGHENKVAKSLHQRVESMGFEQRIFDIIVPTRDTVRVSQGKKENVKEKIFPGYVLVKMILDDESWLLVRTTQGVTAFIGAGNKPTPISEREVEAIQKFMNAEQPLFTTSFTVGEAVKIIDGPFTDFLGAVDNIDEAKGKIKVLVSIFGRETPVELDFLQVSKL